MLFGLTNGTAHINDLHLIAKISNIMQDIEHYPVKYAPGFVVLCMFMIISLYLHDAFINICHWNPEQKKIE